MSIKAANQTTLQRLVQALPVLADCLPAEDAMGLTGRIVLHAGPPLSWERACPTMQAAVLCAIRYEGWATDDTTALDFILHGKVRLGTCHHLVAVGPMTGIITPSMPVFVVENRPLGNRAYVTINEGLGKVLPSSPPSSASAWDTWKWACGAATGPCPRRSTGW